MSTKFEQKLKMQVQLTVIDNLGLKMYASLPPVLSELISNAWDADASEVRVSIPSEEIDDASIIEVSDNGSGMLFDEINATYLRIGRNRRDEAGQVSPIYKRRVMGRKGIGKLSAFGVASNVDVSTVRNEKKTVFHLDLEKIRGTPPGIDYEPGFETEDSPGTPTGTTIRLFNLSRKNRISISNIRRKIARRFACINSDFRIYVNAEEITPSERDLHALCEYTWDINEELPTSTTHKVTGWVGTMSEPVDAEIGAGIVVLARGKLVQEPTHFDVAASGWNNIANPYMVGEINADFLDENEDLIVSNRSSVIWDSTEGAALKEWGARKLRSIAADWGAKRKEKREKEALQDPELNKWFERLKIPEQRIARKLIHAITADSTLPATRVTELVGFMKESFDYQVFREIVNEISEVPSGSDAKLISLFEEWSLIEAREVLRVAEGRLAAISQLETYIQNNAREVPEIHNFLAQYPWILDPSWTIASEEAYYSKLLRDQFPDEQLNEKNRRIDFVCLGAGDTLHIVELKRPKYKIDVEALAQLEDYIAFIRQRLGTVPEGRSFQDAAGYIIGEDIKDDYRVREKIKTLRASRMYVKKYADLLSMARRLHSEFESKINKKTPTDNLDKKGDGSGV